MVSRAADELGLDGKNLLIIENVGNLVCPAGYNLGEDLRVVLLSVTEGEDKPLKYPTMFKSAHVVVITKCDMAEAAGFDREAALHSLRSMCPSAPIFEVSARRGQGMAAWYQFLSQAVEGKLPATQRP
jgi:hydrogenase nickel incorporation protein HypB